MKVLRIALISLLLIGTTIEIVDCLILDRIHDVANKIDCELHKVGNKIRQHEHHLHDPCGNNLSHEDYDLVDFEHKITSTKPPVDVHTASSVTIRPLVPEGKRIISVGSNCPEGYRADRAGNCREVY